MSHSAINWNRLNDDFTKIFWDQNVRQFWVDEEIPLADDKLDYVELSKDERTTYEHILAGLTLLDTKQGDIGIPYMSRAIDDLHQKSVLSFMGSMEHMHAKSYSSIFSTLCTMERIDELFSWININDFLQKKMDIVIGKYSSIKDDLSLYEALSTSVFLESFLFYSGFFYPLYLAGQGKLVNSGEIINLIIRDEAVHGVYVGKIAQNVYNKLSSAQKITAKSNIIGNLENLYEIEISYSHDLYSSIGLTDQVIPFIQYNADKALMNLGMDIYFNTDELKINPIVLNGIKTDTKNHDFFSTKGNGYIKSTNVEPLSDDDFLF